MAMPLRRMRRFAMAIQITCPACGKGGTVPESAIGKKGHCKRCTASFIFASSRLPEPVEYEENNQLMAVGQKHWMNNIWLKLPLAFLCFLAGLCIMILIIFMFDGPRDKKF